MDWEEKMVTAASEGESNRFTKPKFTIMDRGTEKGEIDKGREKHPGFKKIELKRGKEDKKS